MAEETTCDECGMQLSANAPHGLCPRCLIALAMRLARPDTRAPPVPGEQLGDRIGPYELRQRLGEGGCAVVYLAEQCEPVRRPVALKILKPGMDTRQVIARFEAERQALALMAHPNIARVLDGGATAGGRPFFVMEPVWGTPIKDYCDTHSMTIHQRLALFIQVCRAVQHAHQKGIIHRDIKPSNVLVTLIDGEPVAKVIDFGIAKAISGERLTDKTFFTSYQQLLGTPAYMSPEQAEPGAADVDTRTDIYSLGVLLYELVTGRTPFIAEAVSRYGFDALRTAIREQEPLRPSARLSSLPAGELDGVAARRGVQPQKLVRLVRGDLDWVVLKALEKERSRRYGTVETFEQDVERFLAQQPVLAGPPSTLHRLQQRIRRNRMALIAVGAVVVAMLACMGVTAALFLRERQASRHASRVVAQGIAMINQSAALEEKARAEVAEGHRAATLARVRDNWWLHARHGRWASAAADLAMVIRLDADEGDGWFTLAALLLEQGDTAGYRQHRASMLARFGSTTNQLVAADAALACLLANGTDSELEAALRLADTGASGSFDAWQALVKGLAEYRLGNLAEAAQWQQLALLLASSDATAEMAAQCVLAMANFRQGLDSNGEMALCQANDLARQQGGWEAQNLPRQNAFRWLAVRLLEFEAEGLHPTGTRSQ